MTHETAREAWTQLRDQTVLQFAGEQRFLQKIDDKDMVPAMLDDHGNWVPNGEPAIRYTLAWNLATAQVIWRPEVEETQGPLKPDKTLMQESFPYVVALSIALALIGLFVWLQR